MVVAGLVIETVPGAARRVGQRLAAVPGLRLEGDDGERRIAGVWEVQSPKELDRRGQDLVREDAEILGVFPVYVGEDDEDGAPEAEPPAADP